MPTNYQARMKVPAEARADPVSREENVAVMPVRKDAAAASSSVAAARVSKSFRTYPAADIQTHILARSVNQAHTSSLGYSISKRLFDFALGFVLLIIALPIVLIAALAIRINSPGSPFFFQTRLGKNGKPFRIFKLRGMFIDARERFPTYYDYTKKQDLEFCFHHEDDPRVTRAGKFIRKTSIDELPNLWNVVIGDMSLVGPRPEIPEVLVLYGPYREQYLSVKPGVTCRSKCTGRDRLTKKETIEFDLDYIRSRSFWLDIKILWKTFRSVIFRRDVF
jgi:lipopolysaccharide/colanic/teichoic acid biosynthesis glycosyltransferase